MQNLRQLTLFQLYRKLPFIVYKSAYLIPQWPLSNTLSNELIGLRKLE
uniref:Predicted protein n=1 Tax=Hordeum vulgare subsp. vulgare TaxID=112509 RepID=F2E409_HORVV|nr:predicted protein [Hordeum vulgare subsp. vulgare]